MVNSTIDVPSPQDYSIRSLFDGCKKGYIFGIGREKAKNGGVFPISFAPGPGAYTPADVNKKLKVSFKIKLKPIEGSNMKTPGPGTCTKTNIQITLRNLIMRRGPASFRI